MSNNNGSNVPNLVPNSVAANTVSTVSSSSPHGVFNNFLQKLSGSSSSSKDAKDSSVRVSVSLSAPNSNDSHSFEGFLTKIGGTHQSWRRRYFTLIGSKLLYYRTPGQSKPIDSLEVSGATVNAFNNNNTYGRKFLFGLTPITAISNGRMYLLQGESETDRSQWISALVAAGANDLGMSAHIQTHQNSIVEGYLDRIRGGFHSSVRSYFVLLSDRLCYWQSNVIGNTPPEKTFVLSKESRIEIGTNTPNNFSLTAAAKEKRVLLAAIDREERLNWVNAINGVIYKLAGGSNVTSHTPSPTPLPVIHGSVSVIPPSVNVSAPLPSLPDESKFSANPLRKQSNIHDDPDSEDDEDFSDQNIRNPSSNPLSQFQDRRSLVDGPKAVRAPPFSRQGKPSISVSNNANSSVGVGGRASAHLTRAMTAAVKSKDSDDDSGAEDGKHSKRKRMVRNGGRDDSEDDDSDNDTRFVAHRSDDDDDDEDDIIQSPNAIALINSKKSNIALSPNPLFGVKIPSPPVRAPPPRPGVQSALQFSKEVVPTKPSPNRDNRDNRDNEQKKFLNLVIDSTEVSPANSPKGSHVYARPNVLSAPNSVRHSNQPVVPSPPQTPSSSISSLTSQSLNDLFQKYNFDFSSVRNALQSIVDDAERDRIRRGEKVQRDNEERVKEENSRKAADEMKSMLEAKYLHMADNTGIHRPIKADHIDMDGHGNNDSVAGGTSQRSHGSRNGSLIVPHKHFVRAKTMAQLGSSASSSVPPLSHGFSGDDLEDKLIHLHLVEGVDFPAMDANGFSDPYCEVLLRNKGDKKKTSKQRTKTCYETLDPLWNEYITLDFAHWGEELVIDAFDYDKFSVDDFCGRVVIHMGEIIQQIHTVQMANANGNSDSISGVRISGWYPLEDKDTRLNQQGSIFLHLVIDDVWVLPNKRESEAFFTHRIQMLSDETASKWNYAVLYPSVSPPKSLSSPMDHMYESAAGVRLFVGTWNVGNAPPPQDITPWIPLGHADVYVIGTQECNYAPRRDIKTCKVDWMMVLVRHFGRDYTLIKYNNLWEMRVAVFVVNKLARNITHLCAHSEATGVGNVLGNKGGVIISFNVCHTSFCFVNSHLAAHQEHTAARNANVKSIIKNIKIGPTHSDLLNSFHHVFWLGDLNYRLDYGGQGTEKSPAHEQFLEMQSMIMSNDPDKLSDLFVHDQLLKEMTSKRVFVGFKEGRYSFPPTFKVKRRVKLEYNQERSPAWCDRILWRSVPGFGVDQLQLTAATRIPTSDHKPVSATFHIKSFWLPQPLDPTKGDCSMRIFFLHANQLKIPKSSMNKSIDPYLIINSPCLQKPIQTSVQKKVQNPRWTELPVVRIQYNALKRLEKTLFYVRVLNHASNDQCIGRGIIELTGLAEGSNKRNVDKELGVLSDDSYGNSSESSSNSNRNSVGNSFECPPPPPPTEHPNMLAAATHSVNVLSPLLSPISAMALSAAKDRPSLLQSMSAANPGLSVPSGSGTSVVPSLLLPSRNSSNSDHITLSSTLSHLGSSSSALISPKPSSSKSSSVLSSLGESRDFEFTVPLTSNGLQAGTLQGFFRFLFDSPSKKH